MRTRPSVSSVRRRSAPAPAAAPPPSTVPARRPAAPRARLVRWLLALLVLAWLVQMLLTLVGAPG